MKKDGGEGEAARRGLEIPGAINEVGQLTEETARRLLRTFEKSHPVRALRGSQIATALAGSVGFALFVVGVEHAAGGIPVISNAYGSMAVGLVLLVAAGALLKKLSE